MYTQTRKKRNTMILHFESEENVYMKSHGFEIWSFATIFFFLALVPAKRREDMEIVREGSRRNCRIISEFVRFIETRHYPLLISRWGKILEKFLPCEVQFPIISDTNPSSLFFFFLIKIFIKSKPLIILKRVGKINVEKYWRFSDIDPIKRGKNRSITCFPNVNIKLIYVF